jgi:hypothetical protein
MIQLNSTNSSFNISDPSNLSKLEIQFDKGQSTSVADYSNSIISAVSALAGGIIGATSTYLYGRRIEQDKAKREKEREEEFDSSIRNLIYYELHSYYDFFATLLKVPDDQTGFVHVEKKSLPSILLKIDSTPYNYKNLTVERKARLFPGETLVKIESAYQVFKKLSSEFKEKKAVSRSKLESAINDLRDVLGISE